MQDPLDALTVQLVHTQALWEVVLALLVILVIMLQPRGIPPVQPVQQVSTPLDPDTHIV
jgi:ABC-type branched-subunit amino acid transport system permease subunit